MFLYFLIFITGFIVWSTIYTLLCFSASLHRVFLMIGLFCLLISLGLKPSFPSVWKTCVYTVFLCLFFLSGFIGVMWPGKFLITSNSCKTTTPGGGRCMCTFCCLRNSQKSRLVGGCFQQPDVKKKKKKKKELDDNENIIILLMSVCVLAWALIFALSQINQLNTHN